MSRENWKCIILVSAVQVVSESVFFAQGILSSTRIDRESEIETNWNWFLVCVPLTYAGFRHLSEPCWRWIFRGYGNRVTTVLGTILVAVAVLVETCRKAAIGSLVYVLLGGVGAGLVALQPKLMGSTNDGKEWTLWGVGVSGIGLTLWPLLASILLQNLRTFWVWISFAGITLLAVVFTAFVRPEFATTISSYDVAASEDDWPDDFRTVLPNDAPSGQGKYRLYQQASTYDAYRIRPSYCVEILPGIPEETEPERDSEHETEHEASSGRESRKIETTVRPMATKLDAIRKLSADSAMSFRYSAYMARILLRLADQVGLAIVVSFLLVHSVSVQPDIRLQEKAFLASLCGFSRLCSEVPLLAYYRKSSRGKFLLAAGPAVASVGLYLTWNATTLDALTMTSFALGFGTGSAAAALRVLSPRESPGITDTSDFVVGFVILALVPLARILVAERSIGGCFLIGAGFYAAAAVGSFYGTK